MLGLLVRHIRYQLSVSLCTNDLLTESQDYVHSKSMECVCVTFENSGFFLGEEQDTLSSQIFECVVCCRFSNSNAQNVHKTT